MNDEDTDFLLKIVLIGDSGVGKTNLLGRFTRNAFEENTRNTIGVDFSAHDMQVNNKTVKAQFWDTAGQEKYRAIASAYYKNAHGAIIVYDITRRESFENVDNWLKELRENGEKNIQIVVLGNKCDLEHERQVTKEDAKKYAEGRGLYYMETSAKTNEHDCVGHAFNILIEEIIEKLEAEKSKVEGDLTSMKARTLTEKNKIDVPNKSKRCC